jgi:putative phosphoesterase
MRLLIVSDLHANRGALDTVDETVDAVAILGDIVDYGPDPGDAVGWARSRGTWVVLGNHDHAVATGCATGASPGWADLAEASVAWTREALTDADRVWLAALPRSLEFSFAGARFAAFHGAPSDPLHRYLPPETTEDAWRTELDGLEADWLLLGHTHRPFLRRVGHVTILNPGSLGQPRSGVPLATYALWEDGDVRFVHRRYDIDAVIKRLADRPMTADHYERLARTLRTGEVATTAPR